MELLEGLALMAVALPWVIFGTFYLLGSERKK
jgi:hypothetical protein